MSTATDHIPALETELALRGILALLVADRQEREERGVERVESILARAGLDDDQIATIASRARPQSVIDRARETLTQAASRIAG